MNKYIAELLGTFALVFCGTGAIVINKQTNGAITHVGIAITFGLIVMAYKTEPEKDMGKISISYTNSIVKPEGRKYLRTLPAHIKVEFQLNSHKLNLLLVHGSPRKINEYLFEDRDEKSMMRIIEGADADILCFGHTHKPYHRILPTEPVKTPITAMQ